MLYNSYPVEYKLFYVGHAIMGAGIRGMQQKLAVVATYPIQISPGSMDVCIQVHG